MRRLYVLLMLGVWTVTRTRLEPSNREAASRGVGLALSPTPDLRAKRDIVTVAATVGTLIGAAIFAPAALLAMLLEVPAIARYALLLSAIAWSLSASQLARLAAVNYEIRREAALRGASESYRSSKVHIPGLYDVAAWLAVYALAAYVILSRAA